MQEMISSKKENNKKLMIIGIKESFIMSRIQVLSKFKST